MMKPFNTPRQGSVTHKAPQNGEEMPEGHPRADPNRGRSGLPALRSVLFGLPIASSAIGRGRKLTSLLSFLFCVAAGVVPADAVRASEAVDTCVEAHVTAAVPSLSATAAAIAGGRGLVIVALGSSTTAGVGSSHPATTYPALLAESLRRRFPGTSVTVVNKGVSGQLAIDMVRRLDADVLSVRPALVVWQTGTNDLVRRIDPALFADQIRQGIERLRTIGADVVLVDPQYFPSASGLSNLPAYLNVFDAVAKARRVAVFHRYRTMERAILTRGADPATLLSKDGFHLADAGHACMATILADIIERGVRGHTSALR